MSRNLQKAVEDLLHSEKTINEIANDLNFSNKTHFYKLFKEKYGVTPKEFRSQKKNSVVG